MNCLLVPLAAGLLTAQTTWPIRDKTLVAWVSPANLSQRGGSVLTIEKAGGIFDAIVFGEGTPGKWMPGSNFYKRTPQDQSHLPGEDRASAEAVEIAIVYRGKEVSVYRNGKLFETYSTTAAETFGDGSDVLIGLRHRDAAPPNRFFEGVIDEARIYSQALTSQEIKALRPHESPIKPIAWWDFKDGAVTDKMGAFPLTTLVGDARIADGKLRLGPGEAFLLATRTNDAGVNPDSPDFNAAVRTLREKLLSDPYRPGYHFVIPEGTAMPFDPNGAIYWKGQYHLFYIFQDKRGHNWGHVSSTDLFHWRHHPTGLVSGMFSGNCFINKDGIPTMCYHQVDQGNAMAVALDDDLDQWKKLDSNPITPKKDPLSDRYRSWDPDAWIEDGHYYAIFGGNRPAVAKAETLGGKWRYVGDLMANTVPGVGIDEDVSCADFFKIGNKRMLLCISHRLGCRYYLGEWKNEQFHPTFHEKMSWVDNSFFAPESLLDDKGRRIMWSWIFDRPGFGMRTDAGWSGTMSLPRVLSLGSDGALRMNPPEEIERLRYNPKTVSPLTLSAGKEQVLPNIKGNSLEIDVKFKLTNAGRYGLTVCTSPDRSETTLVYYDAKTHRLAIDTTRSSLGDEPKTLESGPLTLAPGEALELRVFVDKSVVEVFANGKQAVMRRIYPTRKDSLGVTLFSEGGSTKVALLRAWDMMPSNPY